MSIYMCTKCSFDEDTCKCKAPNLSNSDVAAVLATKRRKFVYLPTDLKGKPDYENIRTTLKEARQVSDGKPIKAAIYY